MPVFWEPLFQKALPKKVEYSYTSSSIGSAVPCHIKAKVGVMLCYLLNFCSFFHWSVLSISSTFFHIAYNYYIALVVSFTKPSRIFLFVCAGQTLRKTQTKQCKFCSLALIMLMKQHLLNILGLT